jgi:hypothetical protein
VAPRVAAYLHPRSPLLTQSILQARTSCQGRSNQTPRPDINRSAVCLTCFEPHNGLARGIPGILRLPSKFSTFGQWQARIPRPPHSRLPPQHCIAPPLFSIILTDPASTRAVCLSYHCHFPTNSTVTVETKRGVSRQKLETGRGGVLQYKRKRRQPSVLLLRDHDRSP